MAHRPNRWTRQYALLEKRVNSSDEPPTGMDFGWNDSRQISTFRKTTSSDDGLLANHSIFREKLVRPTGLEPASSALPEQRSK